MKPEAGQTPAVFYRAAPQEAALLRSLATRSEAHWSDSPAFLDTFDRRYNITPSFIASHLVYCLGAPGDPLAFWGLEKTDDAWELTYFYVKEDALGQGLGRQLWTHLLSQCRRRRIKRFSWVTSPPAAGFYEKMGAVSDRTVPSSIDGRPIPHFVWYEQP